MFKNQNLWGEKLRAQLRVEVFNILNNTNFQAQGRHIFDAAEKEMFAKSVASVNGLVDACKTIAPSLA